MNAARIAHGFFVLALSSIFLAALLYCLNFMVKVLTPCRDHDLERRELERLRPKIHAYIEKEGRIPTDREMFFLTQDKTIKASIHGDTSDFEVFASPGHDPSVTFEERERAFTMAFHGPYSHYTSRDDSITCHN